jgi:hypothetical protein
MQKYDRDESGQVEFNEFLLMFRDQLLDLKVRALPAGWGGVITCCRHKTTHVIYN